MPNQAKTYDFGRLKMDDAAAVIGGVEVQFIADEDGMVSTADEDRQNYIENIIGLEPVKGGETHPNTARKAPKKEE